MNIERKSLFAAVLTCSAIIAGHASAHASEQGLVLLLPTGAYAAAGTMTVIASIVLVACLSKRRLLALLSGLRLRRQPAPSAARAQTVVSFMATGVLILLVYIGLQGPTDPQNNLLPLTIWTVWWAGVFVVQGLVFDVWTWLNPWTGFCRVLRLGENPALILPDKLAAWPAVVVLLLFQVFLLADVAPNDPQRLAWVVFGYWVLTVIGIELFGRNTWLERVECFSVMFRLIGTLRPLQTEGQLRLGFPGWVALRQAQLDLSCAAFCLIILTGGSFDGVNETFWWLGKIGINPLEFPGRSAVVWFSILGLLGATLLLFVAFGLSIWVGLRAVQLRGGSESIPFSKAFAMFAITFLPIALGYHFAHYLVAFMVQIKFTLSAASDPLAQGWNLLGLGAVKATVGFLSVPQTVKTIWLTQASVVVFSHIVSVLMGHHIAHKLYSNNKDVVLVQVGLTALMIAYTIFGLWLLASPRGA